MEEYLKQFGIFSPTEISDFVMKGELKHFQKHDFLIKEGMICQQVGFIQSGIFRSFYHSRSSEEVTYCFIFPNNLIAAYSSYITGNETAENMQAITDAEVLLFKKRDVEAFIYSNPRGLLFPKTMAEQQYMEMEKRILMLQKESAETKYENLAKEHPEFLHQIPLQYIASYLGITQRHLSRLRGKRIKN